MTIYKVGNKLYDTAMDIQYIDAEDEENAAMIYDKIYSNMEYYKEFFVKKIGLFRITTHIARIRVFPSGIKYKILRKSWKPLIWLE